LKFELVKDLYLGIRLYENFDSKPPVNAPRNDLGITTSLWLEVLTTEEWDAC